MRGWLQMPSSAVHQWAIAERRWPTIREECIARARREVEAQRPFGMKCVLEQLRWLEFIESDGTAWRINNSLAPAWARMLLRDYPEARPYMELRRSRFDAFVEKAR